jgi:hypothetical protein
MIKTEARQTLLCLVAISLVGCNVGMAPSGGDKAQVEANFKQLDPQEQIRIIQSSPAPPDRKASLIKDIETKYGVKAATGPVAGGSQSNPTPPRAGN